MADHNQQDERNVRMNNEINAVSAAQETTAIKPIEVMARVMDKEEFRYFRDNNSITARFPMKGVIANLSIRFTDGTAFFNVSYNIRTPVDRQDEMIRFINASNWELVFSNLEMDPKDGEVRVRHTYLFEDVPFSEKNAEYLLYRMLTDGEKHAPGVFAILTGSTILTSEEEASDEE